MIGPGLNHRLDIGYTLGLRIWGNLLEGKDRTMPVSVLVSVWNWNLIAF